MFSTLASPYYFVTSFLTFATSSSCSFDAMGV
jgi:hypothetical protein